MKKLNILLVFCGLIFGCSDGEDIIDEPLNFLDSEGINLLKNLIDKRTKNQKSNILSTQELIDFQGINFEVIDLNENE